MIPEPMRKALCDVLACPRCGNELAPDGEDHVACRGCGARWPVVDGVLDFLTPPEQDTREAP